MRGWLTSTYLRRGVDHRHQRRRSAGRQVPEPDVAVTRQLGHERGADNIAQHQGFGSEFHSPIEIPGQGVVTLAADPPADWVALAAPHPVATPSKNGCGPARALSAS